MKNMARVAAVMVLALALCQSAMAAPTQGAYMATLHSNNPMLFDRFLQIFGAIWGGGHGAIWGGGHGAVWGGGHASIPTTDNKGSNGATTDGAIWGRCTTNCP